jgi:hypothetical protein
MFDENIVGSSVFAESIKANKFSSGTQPSTLFWFFSPYTKFPFNQRCPYTFTSGEKTWAWGKKHERNFRDEHTYSQDFNESGIVIFSAILFPSRT